jgi:hypothetical protein
MEPGTPPAQPGVDRTGEVWRSARRGRRYRVTGWTTWGWVLAPLTLTPGNQLEVLRGSGVRECVVAETRLTDPKYWIRIEPVV